MKYNNGVSVKSNRLRVAKYLISKGATVNSLQPQHRQFFNSL